MTGYPLLHIGGASTASVVISLVAIFMLMLIMSFAFWRGPQDLKRFSGRWLVAWVKSSTPRVIVAGVFCAGLFVASSLSGTSSKADFEVCGRGLGSLTSEPVTDERLAAGVDGLVELQDAARAGDLDQVRVLIFSDAHAVTHDIDAAVRPLDKDLARRLCERVIALEFEIAGDMDPDTIIQEADAAANLLEEARQLLREPEPAE